MNIDVLYAVSIWLLPVLIAVTFHEAIWNPDRSGTFELSRQ